MRVLDIYFLGIILAFGSMLLFLFTQKHKVNPTRMKVDEKSKMEYEEKQKSLNMFQVNYVSTQKKNKITQITFEHKTLAI